MDGGIMASGPQTITRNGKTYTFDANGQLDPTLGSDTMVYNTYNSLTVKARWRLDGLGLCPSARRCLNQTESIAMKRKQKIIIVLAIAVVIAVIYTLVLNFVVGSTTPEANQMSDGLSVFTILYMLVTFLWLRHPS
jgi:hypothetical protein